MPTRVARAIARLEREGMRCLVLDLRDNPGGDACAFVRLAEDFLPRGSVLARRTDQDGDEIVYRARQDDPYRFPVLILVNRWTASAAELLAGCLQWHGRAALIGEPTYGKGVGRKVVAAPGGFHEADAATFALPGGEPIEGVGLAPDVAAPGGRGSSIEHDPAVRAAIAAAAAMAANDGGRGRGR
jgi:carboxyl-terminal processing protease